MQIFLNIGGEPRILTGREVHIRVLLNVENIKFQLRMAVQHAVDILNPRLQHCQLFLQRGRVVHKAVAAEDAVAQEIDVQIRVSFYKTLQSFELEGYRQTVILRFKTLGKGNLVGQCLFYGILKCAA